MDALVNAMREPVVSLGLAAGASARLVDAVTIQPNEDRRPPVSE